MNLKKSFSAVLLITMLLFLLAPVMAGDTVPFSVDEPDGTNDETSDLFTVTWTAAEGDAFTLTMTDTNTISCYADTTNTSYNTRFPLFTGHACCSATDSNAVTVSMGHLLPRSITPQLYVWCINDQNHDMNAYSSGQLTVTQYGASDFSPIAFQLIGLLMKSLAENAGAISTLIVISFILVLVIDLLTGIFGIFEFFKRMAGKRE